MVLREGRCRVCGAKGPLTPAGVVRAHTGADGQRCRGSGRKPGGEDVDDEDAEGGAMQAITAKEPKFEVRKFRRFTSARGMIGFSADLYVDDRLAGSMENEGNGGGTWLRPSGDREAAGALDAHVLRLVESRRGPDHAGEAVTPGLATEAFLNDLSFKAEEEAAFKRICKTAIVLKLPEHGYGEYVKVAQALDGAVRKQIAERWPAAEIVNDRLGIAPRPKAAKAKGQKKRA